MNGNDHEDIGASLPAPLAEAIHPARIFLEDILIAPSIFLDACFQIYFGVIYL